MNTDHGPENTGDRFRTGDRCLRRAYDDPPMLTGWRRAEPMSFAAMLDVMGTMPVWNEHTAYTTLMEVATGKMETWLRGCEPLCQPKKPLRKRPTMPVAYGAGNRMKNEVASIVVMSLVARWFL